MSAGFAIGAAVAYFADGDPGAQRPATSHAAPPATRPAHTSRSRTAQRGTGEAAGTTHSAIAPAASAEGHRLNDEGYALIRRGDYVGAIPPLRKAVGDLTGAGPADPYEAYANFNLGFALVRTGHCTEALAPLEAANRLETAPAVDRALHQARSCAPSGS